MIPGFVRVDGVAILPPGTRSVTTVREVEERLVQAFPDSLTRARLYSGWRDRRALMTDLYGFNDFVEWVSGSFVTGKVDPADVDVVTLLDGPTVDGLAADVVMELNARTMGPRCKLEFGCDGYIIPEYPDGHAQRDAYLHMRGYWDEKWSDDRVTGQKGYLEVRGEA